ncbi:MAG: M20/M25/M40 family metallo-hydrolase [Gemmataceae bacterium]|nr:M20/M25/M40 family metallo-hydrolase [Gemmataceae bacterium]
MTDPLTFDKDAALARLMRFLAVEGVTGQEKAIAAVVARALREAGVPLKAIKYDTAHERIPLPTQTGNLIATLPGTVPGPRVLFSTHLDTVPLAAGAVPVRRKGRIVPEGKTALGGDNRTGCAVLVTLAATLLERKLPHPPLTLLFTVREESGLFGARHLDPADLGHPAMGFNVDGRLPGDITIGAVGAERWECEIAGKASHAGAHPEKGISATLVAALALAEVKAKGMWGKITASGVGTSNVGSFGGRAGGTAGEATNVVTDYARLTGEARSFDPKFVKAIVKAYKDAFRAASDAVTDDQGKKAKVNFVSRLDYHPFKLDEKAEVMGKAAAAAARAGVAPNVRTSNGGLDANWLVRHGIPTITFGAGQNAIHTVEEWVDIELFLQGCRMALACATG